LSLPPITSITPGPFLLICPACSNSARYEYAVCRDTPTSLAAFVTVVSRDDLENAMKEPEKYQNLIVRVGGFSARFVELNRQVQLDIINRTLIE